MLAPGRFPLHSAVANYPSTLPDQTALALYLSGLDTNSYALGGDIKNAGGQAISGVTVSAEGRYSSSLPRRTGVTVASGHYSIGGIKAGDYLVKAAKAGLAFTPASHTLARSFGFVSVDSLYPNGPGTNQLNFTSTSYGFAVAAAELTQYILPTGAGQAIFSLGLTNTGQSPDTLAVTVTSNQWIAAYPASVGPISPGQGTNLTISIQAPADRLFGDLDTANLKIASTSDAAKTTNLLLTTIVGLGPGAWGPRNSSTSQGKILWMDPAFDDIFFFNGTNIFALQRRDTNSDGQFDFEKVTDSVFALGTGPTNGSLLAAWRRGTEDAWVWSGGESPPLRLHVPNKVFTPDKIMNPEAVAIADGAIFMALQDTEGATNFSHVFKVDLASGNFIRLTGPAPVKGFQLPLTTSGGQAAWVFDDGTRDASLNPVDKLQFYDGSAVREADAGSLASPCLSQGILVYTKVVGAIPQIFLYDLRASNAAPVQLSFDASGANREPRTDGQRVAWIHIEQGTNRTIVFNGGLRLSEDPVDQLADLLPARPAFQLQRGQLVWRDVVGELRFFDGRTISTVLAGDFQLPWLADGFVAYLSSKGVLRLDLPAPIDFAGPAPPFRATLTASPGGYLLNWDKTVRATGYNVYLAPDPNLRPDNFASLGGGRRFANVQPPFLVPGLTNQTYYFLITARDGPSEGPPSEAFVYSLWTPVAGLANLQFFSLGVDPTNGARIYAGSRTNLFFTTDGGLTWSAAGDGLSGRQIRAITVGNDRVYAATADGDIFRSADQGATWSEVVDGADIGEPNKSLAVDPRNALTLYAGDFSLPGKTPADSFVIKSIDGGTNWTHLPEIANGEIRAYTLAVDPVNSGTLYAGGTGVPVVKSTDGGVTWSNVSPASGFVYALAIAPENHLTIYAGLVDFAQLSNGFFKTVDGGVSWSAKNSGFPTPAPRINALQTDPLKAGMVHAGTDHGYYFTTNGGEHWRSGIRVIGAASPEYIYALGLTPTGQLVAATAAGLFLLDTRNHLPVEISREIIISGSSSNLVLSWSALFPFVLEETDTLSPAEWKPVSSGIVRDDDRQSLSVLPIERSKFYRLRLSGGAF